MANPFYVNPLGGVDPSRALASGIQGYKQNQYEDLAEQALSGDNAALERLAIESPQMMQQISPLIQQRQQAAQQEQTQELTQRAMGGDFEASKQLYAANPELGAQIDEAMGIQDERQKEQVGGWLEQYMSATDKNTFLEKTAAQTPFSIDDDMLDMDPQERDSYANLLAGRYLTEDQLRGVGEKYEQGTGVMQGYSFNPEDGTYSISDELKSKVDAAMAEPDKVDAKTRQSINKDLTQLTKDTKLIYNTAKDLEKLSNLGGGPASIAMVFKFMKALDPTSVVREGEFMTAENSAGVPEKMRNYYNKVASGEKLGAEQQADFVKTAKALANSAISSSSAEVGKYLDTFEDTLPDGFKKALKGRIPSQFNVDGQAVINEPESQGETVDWGDLPDAN